MTAYFIRRFLLIIPTFIGISLLVFAITRLVPGGPVERILAEAQLASASTPGGLNLAGGSPLSEQQINELKAYYGLDKPILQSYISWLAKLIRFDLGYSLRYGDSVWHIIKERLPVSAYYGFSTLLLTYLLCLPLGIVKAAKHGGYFDHLSSTLIFIGFAIPGFVVGIALISLLAAHWELFPLGGFVSDDFDDFSLWQKITDVLYHSVLPLIAYLLGSLALITFMLKNALLDNLSADYVKLAVAKGLSFRQTMIRHVLPNSLIPIATQLGLTITAFIGGSFLIETVFNIDGFGLLGYESLIQRDYPVVMGVLVISSLLYLIGNILSDICVAAIDPRIKFGSQH
jgi:microcin C transport system permease protein